ncbi:MAG: superoxide dismutase [Chitinophagaceae bacterium]
MSQQHKSRRKFLINSAKATAAIALSNSILPAFVSNEIFSQQLGYTQQPLLYKYADLEIAIDAATMEIHYTKHAAGYSKNLLEACVAEKVNTQETSLESLMNSISKYSTKMRNNAGGHYNHELFWKNMTPNVGSKPSKELMQKIVSSFGSFDAFKTQFTDAGKNRFGSGWAWLVLNADKQLSIGSTPNQDNPLMNISDFKGIPLLGLDVWEHAYYLRYQNKRADYIQAWWNVVDWNMVSNRFETALQK